MTSHISLQSDANHRHAVQQAPARNVAAWDHEGRIVISVQTEPSRETMYVAYNIVLSLDVEFAETLRAAIAGAEAYVSPVEKAKRLLEAEGYTVSAP